MQPRLIFSAKQKDMKHVPHARIGARSHIFYKRALAYFNFSVGSKSFTGSFVDPVDAKEADLVLDTRSDVYRLMRGWGSPRRHDTRKRMRG
jgi:hypothetical protein